MPLTRADIRLIQLAHAKYPDVKKSLLGGLIIHESQDREVTNPQSGAFGRTQFLPSTAKAYGVKHGDAQSQIFGAAHYLHDLGIGKNEYNALNHYSGGGGAGYQNAVHQLAQQVRGSLKGGPSGGSTGSQEAAGGTASAKTTFTPGGTVTPGDSAFAQILIQQLQQPQQAQPSSGLQDPSFSARSNLHVAGQQPTPSAGPVAPKMSLSDQLAAVRAIQGGTVPTPPKTTTTITGGGGSSSGGTAGAAAAMGGKGHYPLGKRGKIIGVPYSGTHTLGNWQSDNAVDISVPVGTPVYAVADGTIGGNIGSLGAAAGSRFAGLRVQVNAAGNSFWYGHLSKLSVKAGQRVKRGQLIGYSGSANGVAHLHFSEQHGDPRKTVR